MSNLGAFYDWLIQCAQAVLVLGLAPLLSGLTRKIRARLLRRQGPSVLQPYRDLLKLFARRLRLASGPSVTDLAAARSRARKSAAPCRIEALPLVAVVVPSRCLRGYGANLCPRCSNRKTAERRQTGQPRPPGNPGDLENFPPQGGFSADSGVENWYHAAC